MPPFRQLVLWRILIVNCLLALSDPRPPVDDGADDLQRLVWPPLFSLAIVSHHITIGNLLSRSIQHVHLVSASLGPPPPLLPPSFLVSVNSSFLFPTLSFRILSPCPSLFLSVCLAVWKALDLVQFVCAKSIPRL